MSLTGDTFDFQQGNVVTSSAQMVDSAATVGDVLTVQADKSIAAAPGGGSQPMLTAEVPLTNAQIIALGAVGQGTDVQIVAAPGLGSFFNYLGGFIAVAAGAHPYTGVGNGTLSVAYSGQTSPSIGLTQGEILGLFGGDNENAMSQLPPVGLEYFDASQCENLALVLSAFGLGVLGGGNAANSGRVKVWYTIETLP